MDKWQEYTAAGWKLCEIRPGSKAPRTDGWQKADATFNRSTLSAGLVHEHSGTCALDIDDLARAEKFLQAHGIALADLLADPERVQIIGNPNNHGKLLYALPAARKSKKVIEVVDGKKRNILDFRCAGNQDVLPPSMHPDTGVPYAWAYGDPVMGHWGNLPPLPAALDALWQAQLGPAIIPTPSAGAPTVSVEDLQAWLASKDPDMDRDSWVAVGMRIHEATNGQGFYVWDNWSRKGEKYKGAPDLQTAWRSFHTGGGLGVGAILAEKTAAPEDFPIEMPAVEDEFTGEDDQTPAGRSQRILNSRLVYMTSQERFWGTPPNPPEFAIDDHLSGVLTIEGVRNIFTRIMPITHDTKTNKPMQSDPVDTWRKLRKARTVHAAGFDPGAGLIYLDPNDGRTYVNTYKPYLVEPLAPKPGELEAWEFLLSRLQDANYSRWLLQYMAFILRNPGKRVTVAPLLYGVPGTGKSTLLKRVPELLFGPANVQPMSNDILHSSFTDMLANTWFLVLDELKADGGRQDRVHASNKMKEWVTGRTLPIHPKGGKPYKITNRLQITATSNYDDAVHIENNDRRWGICEMMGPALTNSEEADLYEGFLETPRAPGVLKWIMQRVDLTGFSSVGRAPKTEGRKEVVRAGLGTWEAKIMDMVRRGEPPVDRDVVSPDAARIALIGSGAPNAFRILSLLKRAHLEPEELRGATERLYAWRNQAQWRAIGYTAAARYLETGVLPPGKWFSEIPLAIREMAGDDDAPDSNADLLGDIADG